MKNVSKRLKAIFFAIIALALVMVIVFETGMMESGALADDRQQEFILTALMELTSLGAAFLGLRLFKFSSVEKQLVDSPETAMTKWGTVRLLMLELPMLVDTLLYYMFMNATFGYLAIMLLLCLPFVYPSEDRCTAETTRGDESIEKEEAEV